MKGQRDAAEIRAATTRADDNVGSLFARQRELLLGLEPDDRLMQQDVIQHRAQRVVRVVAVAASRLHQVVRRSVTDELTGLVNRRRFIEARHAEIARASRLGDTLVGRRGPRRLSASHRFVIGRR